MPGGRAPRRDLPAFVREKRLGKVFDSSTGYRLPRGNVRSPDASFVSSKRLPGVPEGFLELAPDLAVVVLSPEDSPRDVLDKVGEYLAPACGWCGSSTPGRPAR